METHLRWIQKLAWEASFCPQISTPSRQVSLAAHAMVLQTPQHLCSLTQRLVFGGMYLVLANIN